MTAVKILRYFLAAACFIMAGLTFYVNKTKRDIDIQLAEDAKRILREDYVIKPETERLSRKMQ